MSAEIIQLDVHRARRGAPPRPATGGDPAEVARRCAAGEQLLTTAELCRTLGVSDREVRRWRTATPPVPCVQVTARTVRYFAADVLAWQQRRAAA